jgi:hypothetical protein
VSDRNKISVLIAARKNSKYLSKFLFGLCARTDDFFDTEVLVMLNANDTWNKELVSFFEGTPNMQFYYEDRGLGRSGLHYYFNELYNEASGDWLIYFCEDHFITMNNWDTYLRRQFNERGLDPREPWCLIPKFDNAGAMNQILSRGYCEAIGNKMGGHGWIDSYINDVNAVAFPGQDHPKRVIRLDHEMFHDFTHDHPSPMDESHMQSVLSPEGKALPKYDSPRVKTIINHDATGLAEAVAQIEAPRL